MSTSSTQEVKPAGSQKVVNRLHRLLQTGDKSDLTIHCGGKSFKVHSNILGSASGFFEGVCNGAFQEGTTNVIELNDADRAPGPVLAVLQHIYCDQYQTEECQVKSGDHSTNDNELLLHANVERLAKRFLLPDLEDEAYGKFCTTLKAWPSSEDRAQPMKEVLTYVYHEPELSGQALRQALAEALVAYGGSGNPGSKDAMCDLLDDIFPLAADMLTAKPVLTTNPTRSTIATENWHEYHCGICETKFSMAKRPYGWTLARCPTPHCSSTRIQYIGISKHVNSDSSSD